MQRVDRRRTAAVTVATSPSKPAPGDRPTESAGAGAIYDRSSLTGDYFPASERGRVWSFILGGEIGTGVESFRVYRSVKEERMLAANPKLGALLRNLADDAKSANGMADVRKTIEVNFADYLQFRVSEIKIRSRRWATVFWISEVVLGSLAGTWIVRRLASAGRLEAPNPPAKLDE